MDKDFQDRIDDYILGRMSDEDKAQFEADVNQDNSIKEQLEFTENVKNAICSREDKLARMRVMQRRYEQEYYRIAVAKQQTGTDERYCAPAPQYAEKRSSRRIWWWGSGIAAVLLIGVFVTNTLVYNSQSCLDETIRSGCNDVFNIPTPIINECIINDTVPYCDNDTVKISKMEAKGADE